MIDLPPFAVRDDAQPEIPQAGDDGPKLVPAMLSLADVQPEPVSWLWAGRIATGKLTMLIGDPGLGKSFVTLDIAARVTKGTPWPDRRDEPTTPAGVVLLSAEDDIGDTIRPRLDAAGADVSRVFALQGVCVGDDPDRVCHFSLATDLAALGAAIDQTPGCGLVIVDPISAYLGNGSDGHNNAEIRTLLAPLAALAAQKAVAVLAVTHLRKGDGAAIYRAMGSLAFVAASRAVWSVCRDADDESGRRRLLLCVKNNLAPDAGGLAYRLEPAPNGTAVVAWDPGAVTTSADDALAAGRGDAIRETCDWLRGELAVGPVSAKAIRRKARCDGLSDRTLDRAKAKLGVVAAKSGFGGAGEWTWRLPDGDPAPLSTPSTPPIDTLAHLGELGALSTPPPLKSAKTNKQRQEVVIGGGGVLSDGQPERIPPGWPARSWARHLRHLADACESQHPDKAAAYRERAARIDKGAA